MLFRQVQFLPFGLGRIPDFLPFDVGIIRIIEQRTATALPILLLLTSTAKSPYQTVTAKTTAGVPLPSCLFSKVVYITAFRFFIDTGAEVSVIPSSPIHRLKQCDHIILNVDVKFDKLLR